jgi:hypothetical protein
LPVHLELFSKGEGKSNTMPTNLWKERQTRDYRRANGLYYFCVEPFDANHRAVCTKGPPQPAQGNALIVNDLDVVLAEEVLNQLAIEDTLTADFCQLFLNALSGTEVGEVMKIRALVQNKVMLILIDSDSSHSFFSEHFVKTMGIQTLPTTPRQVKLANGQIMITDQWVPEREWRADGHTLKHDMKVLPMSSYDAILGYDWLKTHSPMDFHWEDRTMTFEEGQKIILEGVKPKTPQLQEISSEQLIKWTEGNDIWAVAVVEEVQLEPGEQPVVEEVNKLLEELQDMFAQPTTLPPSRFYDHQIPLLPNSVPVNSRPYKYIPTQG